MRIAIYNVNGVLIACLYLPNGDPRPGPKFDYKLRWFDRLINYAAGLIASGAPVVIAGDFNVMPTASARNPTARLPPFRRRRVVLGSTPAKEIGGKITAASIGMD